MAVTYTGAGKSLDPCNQDEFLYFLRNIPEAVDELFHHIVHLVFCTDEGNPLVNIEFLVLVRNIGGRNKCIHIQVIVVVKLSTSS